MALLTSTDAKLLCWATRFRSYQSRKHVIFKNKQLFPGSGSDSTFARLLMHIKLFLAYTYKRYSRGEKRSKFEKKVKSLNIETELNLYC